MRIHVQNPADETVFPITEQQWQAAIARSPDMADLEVSFASDDEGFTRAMAEAEAIVTWTRVAHQRFPKGALPGLAPKLKLIFCTSAGLDKLAPFDFLPPGVALLNNRGTHAAKAGEFGIMALLMLANHIPAFAHDAREGRWAPRFGSVLAGRTVCIVGLGSLGGGVAARAKQFGMKVIGVRNSAAPHESCDEVVAQADIDRVLPRAEFLVLACPLTPQTQGLLDRRRLSLLPQGAKVVNIGRGPLWDQEAVCDLLESGHLGGAVTDVTVPEPLPADSRLWRTPGLFITPHMSSDDPGTYNDRSLDIFFDNLRAWRKGEALPTQVTAERGY
ncbi:D-2-hydroxyacid dehydrogenase [Pseudoroseomonas cervicalis]|uniref:4-phosphoerythronate dehydrogenase n=1 Tax=Pseudoroseomonas cervicalis ATCC 49957 TaxID=525371 RepID=D5RGB0_9PROT|nr:D-2-hydroxyacid dehydrogenase [Pseudoroseomonas cervicalis]EFH13658.1 4-phosphoerythronate dehydrogenase [Pseudoroseomonas cervicalis ATCC 49957]